MSCPHSRPRLRCALAVAALGALLAPWVAARAAKSIHEELAVDPQGTIEIFNVSGSVDLSGWDRPQIEVTGTTGDEVERVEVTSGATGASVRVVSRSGSGWGSDRDASLIIHVPVKSAIVVSLVSSDLKLNNLHGAVKLHTVSGSVGGEVNGDFRASAVSGDVHVKTPAAHSIDVRTVSGDIVITGGGGEVDISTVSGDAKAAFATLTRGRFKSVSGDLTAAFTLAPEGQIEGQSVSGKLSLKMANLPGADFDVQTVSGGISNCFGPKPEQSRYGMGSHLTFKTGDGKGHVRIETKSGDVNLCARD